MPNWLDDITDDREREAIALARTYAKDPHGAPDHLHYMLIARLAQRLDAMERELRLHTPPPADLGALDTRILMDIADWSGRHGLALTDAALTDALQQVRNVHYQRLNAQDQLAALEVELVNRDQILDQIAQRHAPDDRPRLDQLVTAAHAAGAKGTWIQRGAIGAALISTYTSDLAMHEWPVLALAPPHEIIVLIRIPKGDGGQAGIEFRE